MQPRSIPFRLASNRALSFLILLVVGLLVFRASFWPDESRIQKALPQEKEPAFMAAHALPAWRTWSPEETAAANPLRRAGWEVPLLKILDIRDEPAKQGSGTRRSWLVETSFRHPYLRVDQELRGPGAGEVVRSEISVADRVLVGLKADADHAEALAAIHQAGFERAQVIKGTSCVLVNLDQHDLDAVPEASGKLTAMKQVLAAEPDGVGCAGLIPNDSSFPTQWHLHNTGQANGLIDADVDAPELWDLLPSLPHFPVAVIDSGLDYNHPDLNGALWTKTGEMPANGIDDDGNGRVDDFRGWDFVNNDNDPMDDYAHGTHVSGIIAARRNNGLGIAGIFPEAQIIPLKVLDDLGWGVLSDLVAALGYVRTLNARVVNMSIQSYPNSPLVAGEIMSGEAQGILYVTCAGNQGMNNDVTPNYPGSHTQDNVICVGNSNSNDVRAEHSNYGPKSVDIFAPGTLIPSTVPGNGVRSLSGTSMAAPHVTAAVAIFWSLRPEANWREVKDFVLEQSQTKEAFRNLCVSGKRLDLRNIALSALPEIAVEQPAGTDLTSHEGTKPFPATNLGQSSTLTFTVKNTGRVALTGLGITVGGTHKQDFAVLSAPPDSVEPDQSATFVMRFSPSAPVIRSGYIDLSNSDVDENPFRIDLQGIGVAVPEIAVFEGLQEFTNGNDTLAYGPVQKTQGVTKRLRIKNVGTTALTGLHVGRTGSHAEDFSTSTFAGSIVPGGEVTLNVTFDPQAGGARQATLNIISNDGDENPFEINLTGTGVLVPEIAVTSISGLSLSAGVSVIDFGSTRTAVTYSTNVSVRNAGSADLTVTPSIIGTHASEFRLSSSTTATVHPGAVATYQVSCRAADAGSRSATLRITSNDADESPFDVALQATGILPQTPTFAPHLQSQLAPLGSPVSLSATVTGEPVINYLWKKATTIIPNASTTEITFPVAKLSDVAAYTIIANNPGGPPASSTGYLGLVTQSQGTQILRAGTTLTLRCNAAVPAARGVSLKYSWRRVGDPEPLKNGTLPGKGPTITGADKATLSISRIRAVDAGAYTCLVTLVTPGIHPPSELTNGNTQIHVVDTSPVVNPIPLPAAVAISQSIDETVTATHLPTGFTVTGLPKGLKMDARTGRITGKPTEACRKNSLGDYIPHKMTFRATNPWSTGPALEFSMVIQPLDPSVVGTFNGTVARSGHSNFGLGGHVQISVSSTGSVSGSATLAGQRHTIVGSVDSLLGLDPTADLLVRRTPASLGDLRLMMSIVAGNGSLQGRIIEPRFEHFAGALKFGSPGAPGFVNGHAVSARFNRPGGIAIKPNGSGYIADTGNHAIRLFNADMDTIATLAGNATPGSADGLGGVARFKGPEGLTLDGAGNLYVADTGNSTIRKISLAGMVTTLAGSAGQAGSTQGAGAAARFDQPCALCLDPSGNLYVADRGNHLIRKITPAGHATTLAGRAGISGHRDGSGTAALFNGPRGITYDPVLKALFVTDTQNRVIRKVTLTGVVTTYAGSAGVAGRADGLLANARFFEPAGIISRGDGRLVVSDLVLVQLNANGTAAAISDRMDTLHFLDHPVALGLYTGEGAVITVDDRLHAVIRHEGGGPLQDAVISARRQPWGTTNLVPADGQGLFNAVIETTAQANDLSLPQGEGFVQISISSKGAATWTGKAADGASLTFGTFMAADRTIPLHVPLYKNTGSLQGEGFITPPGIVRDSTLALDWYKIPQPLASADRHYKGGFMTHALRMYGGRYLPNNLYTYLGLDAGLERLSLGFNSFYQSVTLTAPNAVAVPKNTRGLGLKIDSRTGIFTGSFKEGSPAVTVPYAGILIHNAKEGDIREGRGHCLPPASADSTAPIRSARVRLD